MKKRVIAIKFKPVMPSDDMHAVQYYLLGIIESSKNVIDISN